MNKQQLVLDRPPGFIPEIAPWIWSIHDIRARTTQAVEGLSMEQLEQHPHGIVNTIGALLYHIAAIELDWLYAEVLQTDYPTQATDWFTTDRDEAGRLIQVGGETLQRHLARLDYVRSLFLDTFRRMSLEDFRRPRNLPQYNVTPEWVIYHLLEHEAGHLGQIQMIRKML